MCRGIGAWKWRREADSLNDTAIRWRVYCLTVSNIPRRTHGPAYALTLHAKHVVFAAYYGCTL